MALAIAPHIEEHVDAGDAVANEIVVDPLGFLAGRRYTCYCGRSVIGSVLCRDCAQEMADYFNAYHHVVIRSLGRGL